MSSDVKTHWSGAIQMICLFPFLLSANLIWGQGVQNQPSKMSDETNSSKTLNSIANVKSGRFEEADVEIIAEAGAVRAIPSLANQFVHVEEPSMKGTIASALVRLGDKDEMYWEFLVAQATSAIEQDPPFLTLSDENSRSLSVDFLSWAAQNHMSPDDAEEHVLYIYPGAILDLGITGDMRAVPILRRALMSRDFWMETAAARGLAKVHDKDSVPLIIEACQRAPHAVAVQIAKQLVYFDDSEARQAVDAYVPNKLADEGRRMRAAGEGPFGDKSQY